MGAFVASCSRTPITAMFLAFALTKDLLVSKTNSGGLFGEFSDRTPV